MKKDLDNLPSSRSLARPTRNHRNTPPASSNHPKSRNKKPVTHRFGPNPEPPQLACVNRPAGTGRGPGVRATASGRNPPSKRDGDRPASVPGWPRDQEPFWSDQPALRKTVDGWLAWRTAADGELLHNLRLRLIREAVREVPDEGDPDREAR